MENQSSLQQLGVLAPGQSSKIVRMGSPGMNEGSSQLGMVQRLMEMGFLEGSQVEVVHEAPFGGDPIAVRVRGTLIALRREEANLVWVASV